MHGRSRFRTRARGSGAALSPFLFQASTYGATDAWDFVNDQYVRSGTVGPSGLTVTRASEGYAETSDGRLVKFGSGVLRRTDKGLLVEGARTNLLLRSQAFNEVAWTKANATITPNAIAAPDGMLTADKLVMDLNADPSAADGTGIRQIGTIASNTYTFSIFAKAGEFTSLRIREVAATGAFMDVNLLTGTITNGSAAQFVNPVSISLANGWWRIVWTSASGVTTTHRYVFRAAETGDGVSGFYLWGAQLEAAAFPSSYIVTEGTTVTRAADQVTASLSGVAYPASLFAEFVRNGDTGVAEGVLQVDASSRAQRANINVSSSDTLSVTTRGGANDGDATVTGSVTVGAITKGAGRIAVDDVQAARAGTLATADTTASVPTSSPDTVRFGDFGSTDTYGFNYLRRCAIISRAFTDAELQGITT